MIFIAFLIIGFPIGYFVGSMSRNSGFGLWGNIFIGILGAMVLGYGVDRLALGFLWTIGMSAAGAITFLFVANAFLRRS